MNLPNLLLSACTAREYGISMSVSTDDLGDISARQPQASIVSDRSEVHIDASLQMRSEATAASPYAHLDGTSTESSLDILLGCRSNS